uniref:Uncharacterized protein n=1 Tax=Arundo donax TaxID=35708 RepID=A0A0A9GUS6_ARUDO
MPSAAPAFTSVTVSGELVYFNSKGSSGYKSAQTFSDLSFDFV